MHEMKAYFKLKYNLTHTELHAVHCAVIKHLINPFCQVFVNYLLVCNKLANHFADILPYNCDL